MQITLYTTTTCPYCQQEKEYLDHSGVAYMTVTLDQEVGRLPEFLAASGGFSGVPVTVITADDGKKVVVKGFNKAELDQALAGKTMQTTEDKTVAPSSPVDTRDTGATEVGTPSPPQTPEASTTTGA